MALLSLNKASGRPLLERRVSSLIMFALALASLVGRSQGTAAASNVLLHSDMGPILGEVFELPDGSTGSRFLGINFAKAPVEERRFRAPEAADPWEGTLDATKFGPACHQPEMFDVWMMSDQPLSFTSAKTQMNLPTENTDENNTDEEVKSDDDDLAAVVEDYPSGDYNTAESKKSEDASEKNDRTERSAEPEIKSSSFNEEDAIKFASEFASIPGKKPDVRKDSNYEDYVLGDNVGGRKRRFLVQNYLVDVSEDCLSLNVYTPLFSKQRRHTRRSPECFNRKKNRKAQEHLRRTHTKLRAQEKRNAREVNPDGSRKQKIKYPEEVDTLLDIDEEEDHFSSVDGSSLQNSETEKHRSKRSNVGEDANVEEVLRANEENTIRPNNQRHRKFENLDSDSVTHYPPENPSLPVMVYVHGGSYFGNAGKLYPGEKLASTGMVVVTLNYRLGAFGFLSTGDSAARGNWGLLDQRLALQWVQDHIASFGGDPRNVLLAGNSAGAASVLLHLFSPRSLGLFSRVAAMSGSTLGPWAIQRNPKKFAERLGKSVNCPTTSSEELLSCLRRSDTEELMKNFTEQLADGLWISFAAVVEGEWGEDSFLPHHPYKVLLDSDFTTSVPVLLTFTRDEVSIWYRQSPDELKLFHIESWIGTIVGNIYGPLKLTPSNLAAVIHAVRGEYLYSLGYKPSALNETPEVQYDHPAFIPRQTLIYPQHFPNDTAPVSVISALISDVGLLVPSVEEAGLLSKHTKVYVAQFVFVSPDDIKIGDQQWIGAYHEHEIQYLFGLPYFGLQNTLRHPSNKRFSDTIMKMFREFAQQGIAKSPGGEDPWPQYTRPGDPILSVGLNTTVKHNFLLDRVAFWKKFIPLLTRWPMNPVWYKTYSNSASSTMVPSFTFSSLRHAVNFNFLHIHDVLTTLPSNLHHPLVAFVTITALQRYYVSLSSR